MKKSNQNVYALFSCPVFETKKAYTPNKKAQDFLFNYVRPADIHVRRDIFNGEVYKKPVKAGAVQNFISKDSYVLDNPILKSMKKKFQSLVDEYCYELLQLDRKHRIYITQSRMNFNPKGTGHHLHYHPNSIISSVYFIITPPKSKAAPSRDRARRLKELSTAIINRMSTKGKGKTLPGNQSRLNKPKT